MEKICKSLIPEEALTETIQEIFQRLSTLADELEDVHSDIALLWETVKGMLFHQPVITKKEDILLDLLEDSTDEVRVAIFLLNSTLNRLKEE